MVLLLHFSLLALPPGMPSPDNFLNQVKTSAMPQIEKFVMAITSVSVVLLVIKGVSK